ncbi:MAG: ABC transporter substrate-binding protein [Holophagales bacterium]|nr:ABC transporter substrate-binding protein [Holophagales bacterium]
MTTLPGNRAARRSPDATSSPGAGSSRPDPDTLDPRPSAAPTPTLPDRPSPPALAALAACLALSTTGCLQETATIGVVLPLSGDDQTIGEESKRGLSLAASALVSETGGTPLELIIKDSGSDPQRAAEQLSILFEQESAIAAIGGITTAEARALVAVAEDKERVLISPSAGDQSLSAASKMVYRISHSDASAGATLAAFVHNKLDLSTAVVWAQDDAYATAVEEGFVGTFESLGGELHERPQARPDAAGEAAAGVAAAKPDAVILHGEDTWLVAAISALDAAGYDGRIFGPQVLASPAVRESLGDKAEGVLFTHAAFAPVEPGDASRDFVARYRAEYGEEPTVFAAEAYDSLKVLAQALRDRPPLPGEVRRGLRDEIKAYPGVTGSLEFDDTGAVSKFPRVFGRNDQLALYDYGDWLEQEKERIEEERRRLRERLAEIRSQAAQGAGNS